MVECESFVAGRDPGDHDRQFLENSLVDDILLDLHPGLYVMTFGGILVSIILQSCA